MALKGAKLGTGRLVLGLWGQRTIRPPNDYFRQCMLAIEMPLIIAPMIPTKPWSVPQR